MLSPEEFERILGKARPVHRLAFLLAAHAGLRAGEVRGLRWCDVDLELGHLVVRQSISFGVATTPKSGHERIIPLTAVLHRALDAINPRPSKGFVSSTQRGTPWKNTPFAKRFFAR